MELATEIEAGGYLIRILYFEPLVYHWEIWNDNQLIKIPGISMRLVVNHQKSVRDTQ